MNRKKIVIFLIFAVLLLLPFIAAGLNNSFLINMGTQFVIYALAAISLDLILGYGAMVSFGHAAFFGLGGYVVGIVAYHMGMGETIFGWAGSESALVLWPLAMLSAAITGLVMGFLSLRTSGVQFIMITLAFAQMGYFLFVSLKQYGGDDGTSIANTSQFFGLNLGGVYEVYVVSLVLLILATWWTARLRVSPFGMVLRGARQNARRVRAVGFPANHYLLVAYVLSAMLCGVAGMLLANLNAFASPSTLSWIISGDLVVMLVLGGLGTVFGPVLGALAFLGMEEILKAFTDHWLAVFGLVIVFIGLLGKAGIAGFLESLSQRQGASARVAPAKGAKA